MANPKMTPDMLKFINKSWTPFHAVEEASNMLAKARFKHLSEKDAWKLSPGEKCDPGLLEIVDGRLFCGLGISLHVTSRRWLPSLLELPIGPEMGST